MSEALVRVLVVDDERAFTSLLKSLLEKTGDYRVWVHNEGEGAIEAALSFRPHLIFLDVVMPDRDGGEIAAQIEAHPTLRRTPIVFLTASIPIQDGEKPLLFGGYPYLSKPVTIEEIARAIRTHTRLS